MNLLLDTCAFLWIAKNDANLSPPALEAFRCADNAVFLSSVSAWEISVKWSMGKLALPYPPPQFIPRERKRHFINKLPCTEKDTFHLASLPPLHKDPFDRLLVAPRASFRGHITELTISTTIPPRPFRTIPGTYSRTGFLCCSRLAWLRFWTRFPPLQYATNMFFQAIRGRRRRLPRCVM